MKRSILSLLLLLPALVIAQSNFKNAYVVTNVGDTLRGEIDYKERSNNIKFFTFRSAQEGNLRKMTVADCKAYEIEGLESGRRAVVNISLSEVHTSKISYGIDTTFRRDTVFLKVLQEGKHLTLFSYTDEIKERFYLQDQKEAEPRELIRNIYFKERENSRISENNKYIQQIYLKMIEIDPNMQGGMAVLRNLRYSKSSLIKQIASINGTEVKQSAYPSSRFFIGLGLNAATGGYRGENDLASPAAKAKTSYLPTASGGVDFFINPAIQRTFVRAEVFLFMSKSEISVYNSASYKAFLSHSFQLINAVITPQILHNFYNKENLKVFAGVGAGISLTKVQNNQLIRDNSVTGKRDVTKDGVELKGFGYNFITKAGITLRRKFEISVAYWPEVAISDYVLYNVTMQRTTIGLNYIFGK